MREPPLLATTSPGEHSLRFLWLRSFHEPIAIRVRQSSSGASLTVVRLTMSQALVERGRFLGFQVGVMNLHRTRRLTPDEWSSLESLFAESHHDSLSSSIPSSGRDGAHWVLESARDGRHHVVERWSPKDTAFRAVCERMLDLAGRDLAGGAVY